MGYNLLKSLYIKAGEKDYKFDFTKKSGILYILRHDNCRYHQMSALKVKWGKTIYQENSDWVTDMDFILNGSIKCTLKENGYDSFKAFDNVVVFEKDIYIFQVDDFNLKLSKELYSVPTNMLDERYAYLCIGVKDLGIVNTDYCIFSVVDIALTLLKGSRDIVYENNGLYKIAITDKGKALITRYKIANGL